MAPGDVVVRNRELIRTETGSIVRIVPTVGPAHEPQLMRPRDLRILDDTIAEAEQASGLRFGVYLGDLGSDTRANAEQILTSFGDDAPYTVLLAISPGQRTVEVVTGTEATLRITERGAQAAVLAVCSAASEGNLKGAILDGIRVLSDQAGPVPARPVW